MAYKHVIRAKTKNLFNKNNATILNGYIYFAQLIITESPVDKTIVFPCKPSTTYTFSKMYTNRLFMAETSEETPTIGTTCTNPIANLGEPPSQNYCTLTTTATAKNLIITVCALSNTETYTLQEILDSVQIEEGSTPTPYTPYNYLQSNKRMIKVSDVCQLVDKSQLITEQRNTVSLTNNGDGSISLTGAATDYEWVSITQISNRKIIKDHVYLLGGNSYKNLLVAMYGVCILSTGNKDFGYFSYNNEWVRFISDYTGYFKINLQMRDVILDNFKITPQLFDLTEMFGAGHEPATVAEFRQRFPNEYYPYSPQCWLTSYKSAVVCKTKNLFDVNNAVPYTFTNDNPPSNRISLKDGIYTTTFNNYNVGSGLRIKDGLVLSSGTYTLSLSVITVGETTPITGLTYGFKLYKSDGTKPVITTYTEKFNSRCSHTFTIPADCTDIRLYLAPYCNSRQEYVYISLKDIQLEQGSTATSYVPYQHL